MTTQLNAATRLVTAAKTEEQLKRRVKELQESIAKWKDRNTTGSHDKKISEFQQKLKDVRAELKKLKG